MDTTPQTFGDLIRGLRGADSQAAFAVRLGCSTAAVSRWESNQRAPKVESLEGILSAAGVEQDDDQTRALAVRLLSRSVQ